MGIIFLRHCKEGCTQADAEHLRSTRVISAKRAWGKPQIALVFKWKREI